MDKVLSRMRRTRRRVGGWKEEEDKRKGGRKKENKKINEMVDFKPNHVNNYIKYK